MTAQGPYCAAAPAPRAARPLAGPGRCLASHMAVALLATALGLAPALSGAQPAPGVAAPQPSLAPPAGKAKMVDGHRVITWEELLPPGWDPMKDFRDIDLNTLQDGDVKAMQLLRRMRQAWDQAPSNPAMDGQPVRLPGFVVPLEETRDGLKEFLLVPYFGACIHTPPPPANQIIHVLLGKPVKNARSMDAVWVAGVLRRERTDSYMGASSYRMEARSVEPYQGDKR